MLKKIWKDCHASICSIRFLNQKNERIGSGTGFKIGNFLVTNNHVYSIPGASSVELYFVSEGGSSISAIKILSDTDFRSRLRDGIPESSWDLAILTLDDVEFENIPSLILSKEERLPIGFPIAVFGYQFDQSNLSINQGIISSYYEKASVKYIQIDASVNNGNSGGPLINTDTGRVIGIVTRKQTGLTVAFENLIYSYNHNIAYLQSYLGSMRINGLDMVEALIAGQNQMKITAAEIYRSSNVGIGMAYELDKINEFFNDLSNLRF